jgi:uncharacterized OsmC-like protein
MDQITSEIVYLGNLRTLATHVLSGETIITDAPPDNNGEGKFFSPTDLCATSLACCMLTILGIKANNMGINLGRIDVSLEKVMASNPRRIAAIRMALHINGFYTDEEKKSLEIAGRNCPVAKSLHPDIHQDITFNWI